MGSVRHRGRLVPVIAVAVCLLWSYGPTLAGLLEVWRTDDDYSVGQFVPFVAVYLVWQRRAALARVRLSTHWGGAALLVASQIMRFGGLYYAYASAERLSLIVALAGGLLLLGGASLFRRLLWIQLFLLLMLPPPRRLHDFVAAPLQQAATALGGFGLELLGLYVRRDGNVLTLNDQISVLVAEACGGLRMLTAFVFVAAVVAAVVQRPRWQKAVVLAASVPIAVVANAVRVLGTSLAVYYAQDPSIEARFHDAAGLLMMPFALLLLAGLLWFLAALTAPRADAQAITLRRRGKPGFAQKVGGL